jgi:hypothetical protein
LQTIHDLSTAHDTRLFTEKLREPTTGRFQITTDGFQTYVNAIESNFGIDVDFAQLVKVYSTAADGEQRYSPGEVVDAIVVPRVGMPDYQRISTSRVETSSYDEDVHPATHSFDERFLKEMGQSQVRNCVTLRVLQFLPDSQNDQSDPCDGGWFSESRAESERACNRKLNFGERKMAYLTLFTPHQQPMNYEDAVNVRAQEGILTFEATKTHNEPTVYKFTTNLPFIVVEET